MLDVSLNVLPSENRVDMMMQSIRETLMKDILVV